MNKPLEAVILAGGLSRRMGRDKASLRLGGRRLLTWVREACRKSGLECRVIRHDIVPRCGPLGGMITALASTEHEACLIVSCDMPFVSPALIAALVAHAQKHPQRSWFSHAHDRFGFPACLRKKDEPILRQAIESNQLGVQALVHKLGAGRFRPAPEHVWQLFNVNTPEEWQEARLLWKTRVALTSKPRRRGVPPP